MPNSESDPNCNEKRKYIGNDFVSIVYNDSGADFHIHTIKVSTSTYTLHALLTLYAGHLHLHTRDRTSRRSFIIQSKYNCESEHFRFQGQLNFCIVIVEPMAHGMSAVRMKSKDERILREFLPHVGPCVVSDCNAALLARQLALHCALASLIAQVSLAPRTLVLPLPARLTLDPLLQSLTLGAAPYASNSLERLRAIKRLRRRVEAERVAVAARAPAYADRHALHQRVAIDDFNDYT